MRSRYILLAIRASASAQLCCSQRMPVFARLRRGSEARRGRSSEARAGCSAVRQIDSLEVSICSAPRAWRIGPQNVPRCSQNRPNTPCPHFGGHRVVPCWRRGRTPIVRPGPQGCRPRPLAAPCGPGVGGEPTSRACRAVRPSRHCHASRSSQLPTGAAARVWPAVPSWVVPFRHFPGKRGVWCLLLLSSTSARS